MPTIVKTLEGLVEQSPVALVNQSLLYWDIHMAASMVNVRAT